jgi:glucosylceramidase
MVSKNVNTYSVQIYETSQSGHSLTKIPENRNHPTIPETIIINPEKKYQKILGFGGSFTEASAYLVRAMSDMQRENILNAYFSDDGARYSLTRTHINSCDFSLSHYAYDTIPGDTHLEHFSIQKDIKDLFPMIHSAQKISTDGFRLIASPWTAPPWLKDNNDWIGGKLLNEYKSTWAKYYAKYIKSCKEHQIPIWGITVINEPHGNGGNWESMLFTPQEMTDFVQYHLGPTLENEGLGYINILGYDQNRAGLKEWVDTMYKDESTSKYFDGTAIHWYESTVEYFPEELLYASKKAPNKFLIQTEACIDSELPRWKDDSWYWKEEATDWGWDWAPQEQKYLHPKYVPVHRYARDIIGCLQNSVHGWIDWNMVLDRNGGPNWAKNWCIAPILVDTVLDEVYYTPLYYVMCHFSKYIRPDAKIIESTSTNKNIMVIASENPDGSIIVVIFNPTNEKQALSIQGNAMQSHTIIDKNALQTIVFTPN